MILYPLDGPVGNGHLEDGREDGRSRRTSACRSFTSRGRKEKKNHIFCKYSISLLLGVMNNTSASILA